MAVIVVLSDCPPKLRGDMSKWFFEINTGVYVGNFSARVRENIWERITENIGHGHATMAYSAPGEQHLDFRVHNAYWEPVDFDGIKLMRRPECKSNVIKQEAKEQPISNVMKRKLGAGYANRDPFVAFRAASYVVLDFETTGLDAQKDEIIEIGAILVDRGKPTEHMQTLVRCRCILSKPITELTGITQETLDQNGISLKAAIVQLLEFAEDLPFVSHNASFEQDFLQGACAQIGETFENRFIDTLKFAQILLPDMDNHKLATLAEYFNLPNRPEHRALADCRVTYEVYSKFIEQITPDI